MQKYVAPTRLDCEPLGTVWEHLTDHPTGMLYIQVSDTVEQPEWIAFGDILASTFREKAFDKAFIKAQIKNYNDKREPTNR